jgi:hypothetical protein
MTCTLRPLRTTTRTTTRSCDCRRPPRGARDPPSSLPRSLSLKSSCVRTLSSTAGSCRESMSILWGANSLVL